MGLLDAILKVRGRPAPGPPPPLEVAGKKILLVYLFPALGDAVLLAPVARALIDAGAKPPIGLLLRESAARAWKHVDLPIRVHVLPESLVARPEPVDDEAVAEVLKLTLALRKRGYVIAADLTARDEVDARLWLERAEAPIRLGFLVEGEPRAETLTWGAPDERIEGLEHWTRYLAAPLAPLRLGRLPAEVPFKVSPSAAARAEALFGAPPRLVLVPGSRSADKRAPEPVFRAAGRLALERGGSVVVVGGPGEEALVGRVAEAISKPSTEVKTYAKKALGPLVALVTSADAVVTNDTGPMHLAFLSGRRTIALFSTMSAACWGPMREDPRFSTLTVPRGLPEAEMAPFVERVVLDRLSLHLDAL